MSGPVPEPEVPVTTSRRLWIALLSGPSLWFGHFMGCYLLTEAVCAAELTGTTWAGLSWPAWTVIALTLAALVVLGIAAQQTWAYRHSVDAQRPVLLIGLALDALFAVGILFTGIPAALLETC